ncbi:MAG TPA: hypothetical protein VGG03_10485 [Thermoanaerobaculia bacterium]|jgi:tetratricopeptide (TPR) repeat protein
MSRRGAVLIAILGMVAEAELVPVRSEAAPVPTPPIRALPAAGVGVESAALLLSGQEGGEISLGVLALAAPGEAGKTRILFRLRINGPELLAGQTGDALRTEISLYVLDVGGGVQNSLLETVETDLAALRGPLERYGVDFLGSLELRPGSYSLRVLARNLETGRLGVRALSMLVPDPASLQVPALSPPPESDPRPTARSSSLGPLDPPPFPDDAPLPPQQAASPAPEAAAGDLRPPLPLPDTAEGRQLRSAVRAAYREALGRLVAGREAEAAAAVTAFEDTLLRRPQSPVPVEHLLEIETGVARELAAADVESLVPLLRLHQRLYEEGTVKKRHPGSTQAREMFLRLMELYRQRGRPELARQLASTFGIGLVRSGVRSQGEQLLRQVLADDPGDEMVLLELAVGAERRGARAESAAYLEALLRAHPDHPEARLRLALDLARLGRKDEAIAGLRRVIQAEAGGWRLSLAYQELARLLLAADDPTGAERALREGLRRLPGDEKLTLLLAALLERAGRAFAREALAGLQPEGNDGGGTARHRYNLPPQEPLATALAGLAPETAKRLPNLAAALEKTGP